MYVNSADGSIYIGDGENAPIKLITETNIGDYETGGSSEDDKYPYYPKKSELTLGNTITWARHEWIVCHVTDTEAYLALNGTYGSSTVHYQHHEFENFDATINVEEKKCLKVYEHGSLFDKVTSVTFVARESQLKGEFAWFTSDAHRSIGAEYWSSTYQKDSDDPNVIRYGIYVTSSGSVGRANYCENVYKSIRPFVCVDLTLYV